MKLYIALVLEYDMVLDAWNQHTRIYIYAADFQVSWRIKGTNEVRPNVYINIQPPPYTEKGAKVAILFPMVSCKKNYAEPLSNVPKNGYYFSEVKIIVEWFNILNLNGYFDL